VLLCQEKNAMSLPVQNPGSTRKIRVIERGLWIFPTKVDVESPNVARSSLLWILSIGDRFEQFEAKLRDFRFVHLLAQRNPCTS